MSYVALFVVGLVAYRRDWLRGLPDRTGRRWLRIAGVVILLWPPMMLAVGALSDKVSFKGGLHWQSTLYAFWEAFLCVSMCIAVIYFFRRRLDRKGKLAAFLIPNAYTAYLIHAPVILTLSWEMRGITWYPLLKWALVSLIAVPLCFGLSALVRMIPYTDRKRRAPAAEREQARARKRRSRQRATAGATEHVAATSATTSSASSKADAARSGRPTSGGYRSPHGPALGPVQPIAPHRTAVVTAGRPADHGLPLRSSPAGRPYSQSPPGVVRRVPSARLES